MGEKNSSSSSSAADWCDVSVKCRCRWRWSNPQTCSKCHDKLYHRTCSLSSTFIFFLCAFLFFGGLAWFIAWLTLAPFKHEPHLQGVGCQPDNEGSWAIGFYRGTSPFELRSVELENLQSDVGAAWPVANPVITCASIKDPGNPSNFVADPFLFLQVTDMYVFFETKNSLTLQGDIGVARSTDQGATWQFLGIALDEEWHLSYPFIFEYESQIYMMPEGSKKGDLRLYRATNFPLEWTLEKVLIKKPLIDASMVEYEGMYWIFASDFTRFGVHKNGELEIWYANTPLGPWKQHKRNPVRDVPKHFGARNGGRLFTWEGRLYRPGQDSGGTYGKRLKIFQVEKLTTQIYREVEVPIGIEEPNWGKGRYAWNGVRHHHLDVQRLPSGDWVAVMDGDRVPSGDRTVRISVGLVASFIVILLICSVGILFGFVSCIYPSSAYLKWNRGRSHVGYKAVSRLNSRNGGLSRGKLRLRTCIWACLLVLIVAIGVLAVVVSVRCFLGGNGAEEPYPLAGQFSQFTMVTMTYDARLWNLKMYVKHYSRCASVREIVVVWNKGIPPDPLTEFDSAVPVRIRVEPVNSLNNRFRVDPLIKTKAVLELDDDIMMTCDDVERGFKAWREHPDRLVGFYPRLIDGNPLEYRNERYARRGQGYNMILTGAAFINNHKYFQLYSNEDNKPGRAIVDELFNCEDILMNFILGNGTDFQGVGVAQGVEYIHPSWAVDTSKLSSSAISRDTKSHYNKRTECLQKFSRLFNKVPLKKVKFNNRKDGWDY